MFGRKRTQSDFWFAPTSFHKRFKNMEQPDFFPIPSPCIGVCEANAKGYCKGCLRSREERLYWQKMTDDQKHQVMRLLSMRKTKIRNRQLDAMAAPEVGVEAQSGFLFEDEG